MGVICMNPFRLMRRIHADYSHAVMQSCHAHYQHPIMQTSAIKEMHRNVLGDYV